MTLAIKMMLMGLWKALWLILSKMVVSALSETVLKWTLFALAEKYVESTKTPLDDAWLAKMKTEYEANERREDGV